MHEEEKGGSVRRERATSSCILCMLPEGWEDSKRWIQLSQKIPYYDGTVRDARDLVFFLRKNGECDKTMFKKEWRNRGKLSHEAFYEP